MLFRIIFAGQLVLIVTSLLLVAADDTTTLNSNSLYNCDDWECGVDGDWISKGKTLLRYIGKTERHLSFQKNEDIYVMAKPKDKSLSDWVGKIGDKIGFAPVGMIREDKMNSNLKKRLAVEPSSMTDDEKVDVATQTETVVDSSETDSQAQANPSSDEPAQREELTLTEPSSEEQPAVTEVPEVTAPSEELPLTEPPSKEQPGVTEVPEVTAPSEELPLTEPVSEEQPAATEVPEVTAPSEELPLTESSSEEQPTVSEVPAQELPLTEPPSEEKPVVAEVATPSTDIPSVEELPSSTEPPEEAVFTEVPTSSTDVPNETEAPTLDQVLIEPVPETITEIPPAPVIQTVHQSESTDEPPVSEIKNPFEQPNTFTFPSSMETREPNVVPDVISGEEEPSTVEIPELFNESPPVVQAVEEQSVEQQFHNEQDHHDHNHDHHHHHHHHHHRHNHDFFKDSNETSSIILVIKHLSSTLLSFLPEPLQDTILDVDDALVFTGIIALTLVSICVPYFLIEGFMSVRPLKKKVVELNKSLWKVSAAYETQQEEFELFKQKAIAHDEFKKRAEQSENDVIILKKLETKHREQITALKTQLKSQMKEAVDIRALIEKTLQDKKTVSEECGKYKAGYENAKEALTKTREELTNYQTHAKSSALQLGVSSKNAEMLTSKIAMLHQEMEEIKSQLVAESEKRKIVEKEKQQVEQSKMSVEKELTEIKSICHQYESTVGGLNEEISKLESELASIKDSLGEDSPLLEVAEIQAKAAFSEKEAESLRTRLEGFSADNENLSDKLKATTTALEEARNEREHTNNRLQVLETYFKEREEEYIKTIEQLQLKENVRDKGKEELIRIIEEKENVCKDLNDRLEALKEEFEETKQQHRNEIRSLEAKGHENWLSLCQAERKAQDARKESELLRQRLTTLSKEKDDEDVDGLNGEVPMFPIIPHELVPLPILDEPPSYFGLGDFVPPPPLPEGEEREPHRPPPLGGRLSPSFSDLDDNILSPIGGVGRREDDCTDGSSGSDSPRRRSPPLRGGWVNVQHDRGGQGRESMRRLSRATSSPIQPGANL